MYLAAMLAPDPQALRLLLFSALPAHLRLALELIEGQGLVEHYRTELYLLAIWVVRGADVLRVRQLLGIQRVEVMTRYMSLGPDRSGAGRDPLTHMSRHPEIDSDALMAALVAWKRPDFSPIFFFERASPEQLCAVLASPERPILSHFRLLELPPALRSLHAAQALHIDHNRLQSLPDWLPELSGLRLLDASDNDLRALPVAFTHCFLLEELDLSRNPLRSIAPLARLPLLHTLRLQACSHLKPNSLLHLPPGIQTLDLSRNLWTTLPASLVTLPLRHLNVAHMPIDDWDTAAVLLAQMDLAELTVSRESSIEAHHVPRHTALTIVD
jgi:hypothetical protein